VRVQISSLFVLLTSLSVPISAFAQAVRPAQPATGPKTATPAPVAPAAATLPAAPAQTGPVGAANADPNQLELREAPRGSNPVLAAFTPQPGGLTANEVATRAAATSDTIAAKNAELKAAAAAVDSAMYQFYPKLSAKASYTRLSPVTLNFGGAPIPLPVNTYSLGASLGVPLSDYILRLSESIDATKKNQESSELNLRAERQKVEADARVAFFNWALSIGQVAVTEKSLERVKARLKDAQTSFTLGAATKADVLRLQALVAATESGLVASQSFKQLAEEQLATIMDVPPQEYVLGEDVLAERSPVPLQPLETLVQHANTNRDELKALDRAADSMRMAESVIRKGTVPRIDGFADYAYAKPNQRYFIVPDWKQSWDVGLAATWNINEIFTSNSSGNEMAAKRQALEANRKAMSKGIRMEVASAYTDTRKSAAALESAKRGAEAAQAAYDTEVQLFKVGRATTTELIDAESELVNALLALISAHVNIRIAETKLARAVGNDMHTMQN
jgi:outer membrane protein